MISKESIPAMAKLGHKIIFGHLAAFFGFLAYIFGREQPHIYGVSLEQLLSNIIFPVFSFFMMGCFLPVLYIRVIMSYKERTSDSKTESDLQPKPKERKG